MPPPSAAPDPDTGAVPPELAAALTAHAEAGDTATYGAALAALADSRLLLAMVEVPADSLAEHDQGHDQGHGHGHGSTAMAAVSIQRGDGRRGLLAFTGLEPLARWDGTARPLPVATREAAESAVRDGAAALLIDLAGPARLVVEGDDLAALAAGWTAGRVGEHGVWIRPTAE